MKLNELPHDVKNAVLQSAMRVMSESADMTHMLQKADLLINHDFKISEQTLAKDIEDLEEQLALAKWVKAFTDELELFFAKINYPKKFWRNTIQSEMYTWVVGDEWKTTTASDAAKSNISYWEK